MHVDGGCHCGRVTYEAEIDPAEISLCHCTDCQALTGTAYRVSAIISKADFRLTGEEPTLYVKTADNGRKRFQYFCPTGGSPIYTCGEGEDAEIYAVRVGTIRQRRHLEPTSQIWCSSALPWINRVGSLPSRSKD